MTQRKHAAGPDFFLVAGHGVGATSLRAYCRIVGLPLRFPWQEELPRLKDPLPLVGCIIDRPARIPASWRRDIPIFWLLRDPFAALFNVINNNIWFSSATVAHRNWPWAVSAASLASFCHGHRANLSLLHSSRLLSVYGGRRDLLYCLDHQCLYQDSICETMQFICNALGFDRQDIVSEHAEKLYISYGKRTKLMQMSSPCHYILRRVKDMVLRCRITTCPLLWLEFKYAHYDSYQILGTFSKDGEEFAIVCDDIAAACNQEWEGMTQAQLLGHFAWLTMPSAVPVQPGDVTGLRLLDWEREALMDSLELFMATLRLNEEFLQKRLLDRDRLFELMWENTGIRMELKNILDREMPLIRRLAPEIYKNFSYVHEFYQRYKSFSIRISS